MTPPLRRPRLEPPLLAAITLVAFALRLVHLGADSLWYDETVSVYLAGQPAAELIAHTARDIHPPLYYLLLRGWLLVAGYPTGHADSAGNGLEFMAAFLSLWFGVLLVPLTWRLARRLGLGSATATLSALLVAISPFGIWYSQEVRMYTLGACLGVAVLLATVPFLDAAASARRLRRAAILYALAAAAGLYTLYYFAFLLMALNLVLVPLLILRWLRPRLKSGTSLQDTVRSRFPVTFPFGTVPSHASHAPLLLWLAAQAGALLLYLPWLPIAWRQATNPPVPPWRTAPQLLHVIVESWTALAFGQSANPLDLWPLLLLALALLLLALFASRPPRSSIHHSSFIIPPPLRSAPGLRSTFLLPPSSFLLLSTFGPLLLILLASILTPLYHVRYLATFAPAFSVLLAMGVMALWQRQTRLGRALAAVSVVLLAAGSAASLQAFWTDPAYTADDLRAAVRDLAQRWRPGDPILVNAGYAYPALLTYWPLPVAWTGRLPDYTAEIGQQAAAAKGAAILQTGHVDGDPNIGWGDPRSDFYALPADVMQDSLRRLDVQTDRLWQVRIYDTVNDPEGQIRAELAQNWTPFDDRVYPGEANLRVQGWEGMRQALSSYFPPALATFDGWLAVAAAPDAVPAQVESGAAIDVPGVVWRRPPEQPGRPVALSLRLLDEAGAVWAALDEPLGGNQRDLTAAPELVQPLRLDVPAGTPPGAYILALVVYDPQTGQPLPAVDAKGEAGSQAALGQVQVVRPAEPPAARPALADFGPLRLVEGTTPATAVSAGDAIPLDLLWQAAPGYAAEPLVVVVQLIDGQGQVAASLEEQPLAGRYSADQWQPGELVRDRHALAVPASIAPGQYTLIVGLYRAVDRQRLEAASGLLGLKKKDSVEVRTLEVR